MAFIILHKNFKIFYIDYCICIFNINLFYIIQAVYNYDKILWRDNIEINKILDKNSKSFAIGSRNTFL